MKILQTVFGINDFGGIVNHVELLHEAFIELGHEPEFVIMKCDDRPMRMKKPSSEVVGTYKSSAAGFANTISGWYGASVVGYGSEERIDEWRKISSQYDLVIHQLPVPKPDPDGWWRRIYTACEAPQIAVAHDAHFRDMYPHMIEIARYLKGVSVTNPAGYHALEWLPAPRCFIGAPHRPMDWRAQVKWGARKKIFTAAHVWKAWKRMDWVLRAMPLLAGDVHNFIGGDGIEARYMRSKDKCKEKYEGLWKAALKRGRMNYLGLVSPSDLAWHYTLSRAMVDMSFSEKFAALGNHFNRSTIEAYNGGCVPLVITENMRDDTGIFVPGRHYVHIHAADAKVPERLAEAIEYAVTLPPREAEKIVEAGRGLLTDNFHYHVSAQGFVDLARGKKQIGIYGKLETGKLNTEIRAASRRLLEGPP